MDGFGGSLSKEKREMSGDMGRDGMYSTIRFSGVGKEKR